MTESQATPARGVAIDATTAERIELAWLRAAVAPVGAFGRRHDASLPPYGPGDEAVAHAEIADVLALAARFDADGAGRVRAALRAVPEPGPIVARLRAGDALADVDFYELGRFVDALDALRRAWDAAHDSAPNAQSDRHRPPLVDGLRDALAPGRNGPGFYLADAFAPGLRAARSALAGAEAGVDVRREALAARVRDAIGVDPVGDEFVVLRDVYDGPPPADVHVVRESPTYRVFSLAVVSPERDASSPSESSARRSPSRLRHVRSACSIGRWRASHSCSAGVVACRSLPRTVSPMPMRRSRRSRRRSPHAATAIHRSRWICAASPCSPARTWAEKVRR